MDGIITIAILAAAAALTALAYRTNRAFRAWGDRQMEEEK